MSTDGQSPQENLPEQPVSQEIVPQAPPQPLAIAPAPNSPYHNNEVAHEIRNRETQRRAMEAAVTRSEVQQTVVAVEQIDMENQEELLIYYEGKIQELERKLAGAQTPVTQGLYQRQLEILALKVEAVLGGESPADFGKLPQHRESILPQTMAQVPQEAPLTPVPETRVIVQPEDERRIAGPAGHILTGLLLAVRQGKHYRPLLPQEKEAIEAAVNS